MIEANVVYRTIEDQDGNVTTFDVTWDHIRSARNIALEQTDWWVFRGSMTDAQAAYRTFLRDMPANYSSANDAADAWRAYDVSAL
tara:strand:+ start:270 stop:524 length:255 start_codon:yes stop_codon:yes gene_type:complete